MFEGSNRGKKRKLKDASILASAEEVSLSCLAKSDQAFYLFLCNKILKFLSLKFGYLLDENAGSKFDNIGMNAMANRDNASKYMLQIARYL